MIADRLSECLTYRNRRCAMADLSKAKLETVKMRLITEVEGVTFTEEIDSQEKFMADLIVAIRNGRSPANALAYLADVGFDHLEDPKYKISRSNRIGHRE